MVFITRTEKKVIRVDPIGGWEWNRVHKLDTSKITELQPRNRPPKEKVFKRQILHPQVNKYKIPLRVSQSQNIIHPQHKLENHPTRPTKPRIQHLRQVETLLQRVQLVKWIDYLIAKRSSRPNLPRHILIHIKQHWQLQL